MNLDITFCTGLRCAKKKTCKRYIRKAEIPMDRLVSVAEFSDHDGNCDEYWELEK